MVNIKNKTHIFGIIALLVLAAVSLSCRLPLVGSGETAPATPTGEQGTAKTTPSSASGTSSADGDTDTAQGDQRPPASFNALLERGIEEGRWTRGEGLHYLLQVFQNEQMLETEVSHQEWTMVLLLAADYVENGEDPELKNKINEQLQQIAAPLENLSLYSAPAEAQQSSRRFKVSRPSTQVNCGELFTEGFPETRATTCLLYQEVETPFVSMQIYYPQSWAGDEKYENIIERIKEFALRSTETYAEYGPNEDLQIIFSPTHTEDREDPKERRKGSTMPPKYRTGDACPMIIFNNPTYLLGEDAKEIIAHEIFHCFQMKNFFSGDKINYTANKWWMEGTAVHFSNVAFPSVKYDYKFVNDFDVLSQDKQLKDMSYGNYVFFTDWMNHKGNQNIINFLHWLSINASAQTQMGELAIYEDMDVYFHLFGQRYLDKNIPDPAGDKLPIPAETNEEIEIDSTGEAFNITFKPFQLYRLDGLYEPERRFFQAVDLDYRVDVTMRPDDERDTWEKIPDKLYSRCREEDPYLFLITSTDVSEDQKAIMKIDEIEEAACDGCLLGDWQVENDTFVNWFNALAGNSTGGGSVNLQKMSGFMGVKFSEDRAYTSINKQLNLSLAVPGAGPENMALTITSLGEGSWLTNQEMNQLGYSEDDLKADISVSVPGVGEIDLGEGSVPEEMMPPGMDELGGPGFFESITAFGGPPGDGTPKSVGYTCSEDSLTIHYPQLSDIILDRLDEPVPLPTFEGVGNPDSEQ